MYNASNYRVRSTIVSPVPLLATLLDPPPDDSWWIFERQTHRGSVGRVVRLSPDEPPTSKQPLEPSQPHPDYACATPGQTPASPLARTKRAAKQLGRRHRRLGGLSVRTNARWPDMSASPPHPDIPTMLLRIWFWILFLGLVLASRPEGNGLRNDRHVFISTG